ncbi:exported hypothetical protein [Xenorhabdus bovienii str. kraussei Quebec]|uniref:Uncharacterized protein n=1 Tax=Xenorhabdus bovienii str. kraussei Quebec TaxID=1398203 RepID=A0A077P3L5_XENBV|nr:DUF1525 domain-containing protein [Xenorhabdus bovienii]CDH19025.1 exported hypothetical protein [Xenorhabdus bovienii str. kraussei Quebec]
MKKPGLLLLMGWMVSLSASAKTVIYTDSQHPPVNLMPDSRVVWLDAPERFYRINRESLYGGGDDYYL